MTDFFQTKVYLFAFASIFVPLIKTVFPEISPRDRSSDVVSARRSFEQAERRTGKWGYDQRPVCGRGMDGSGEKGFE